MKKSNEQQPQPPKSKNNLSNHGLDLAIRVAKRRRKTSRDLDRVLKKMKQQGINPDDVFQT